MLIFYNYNIYKKDKMQFQPSRPQLKTSHKVMIGSFTFIIIIALIVNSIFLYIMFIKINMNYQELDDKITNIQADYQSRINELSSALSQTEEDLGKSIEQLKATTSDDFSGIIERSVKGVVTIKTNVAQGTGFIITDEGYVVTNAHVLVGGYEIQAITSDQQTVNINFVGYDGDLDIALLKMDGNYNSLNLGNSDDVQVGEKVIAIGNPLGLQFSVSEGIISGIHREGLNELKAYIQTDAALNPGNSGGPLIDKDGTVIGMNNFKVSGGENLGFALESNYIKETVNAITTSKFNQTIL